MDPLNGAAVLPPMEPIRKTASQQHAMRHPKERKPQAAGRGNKLTRDRFTTLNDFVDCSLAGLTKAEIGTWLVLYRDTKNGTAKTSQGYIAKRAGISTRSVGKSIASLIRLGLLVVVHQGGLNKGPSVYRVESLRNRSS